MDHQFHGVDDEGYYYGPCACELDRDHTEDGRPHPDKPWNAWGAETPIIFAQSD